MDRVEADNENVLSQVLKNMNRLSARSKNVDANTPGAPAAHTSSSHPPGSIHHSVNSRSVRSLVSGSSRASSRIRAMQLESKVKAAALKKKLEASKATQALEQKALQISMAIEQSKIQAELDVAEAEEQVISQAMEEEEVSSLFNPPSQRGPVITSPGHDLTNQPPQPIIIPQNNTAATHVQTNHNIGVPPLELSQPSQSQTPAPQLVHLSPDTSFHSPIVQGPVAVSPLHIGSSAPDQQAFATTLAQAIHTIKLKPAEPSVFYDNPLEYLDWKVAFEGLIESGSYNPLQKLALLQQYLGGKAKRVVANLFQIGTEEAFQEAKRKLNNKFGKTNILTEAYRSKLEHWPHVKEHDGEALEELVSFLKSCKTAMKKLPELQCLNDRRENEKNTSEITNFYR